MSRKRLQKNKLSKMFSVSLGPDDLRALDQFCKKHKLMRSPFVREAIKYYILQKAG